MALNTNINYNKEGYNWPSMQPMNTAPRDRKILIKLAGDIDFIIAEYAKWDEGGPYTEVWEIAPGQCFVLNSKELEGWWDLPKVKP